MAFSTTGTSGGASLSSEINVTPLIDVLLVMLIIFMMIVPEMPQGLNSALPSDTPGAAEAADRPILVEVEQGETAVRYLVDGVGLERAEVAPRLQELLSRRSVRQVLLKADAKLDFAVVAGVIDAGKAAGAESVGIADSRIGRSDEMTQRRQDIRRPVACTAIRRGVLFPAPARRDLN